MCGITGYVGKREAKEIIFNGLEKLEYRGYDSAGIAVIGDGKIKSSKSTGRLAVLREQAKGQDLSGHVGIGHTRWATHGAPSVINSHPHFNKDETIYVVHNGIIENYRKLKKKLAKHGYEFISQTDTEVIPMLIDYYYEGDLLDAVIKTTAELEGSYAICAITVSEPDKIVAVRKDSPLIAGIGDGENFLASDIPAILKETRKIYLLEENEFVVATKDKISIYDADKNPVSKEIYEVTFDETAAEKNGYDHFMLKEIYEQPDAVKNTLRGRVSRDKKIALDGFEKADLSGINKIFIVACGTAYHAGLIGKTAIEQFARIPVEVDIASEFRYRNPMVDEKTLLIVVSQSGETADTLAALRLAKERGSKVFAITNVVASSIAREADFVFYTYAGPEIAVASTKAYTTQLIALYTFALFAAQCKKTLTPEELDAYKEGLLALPEAVKKAAADVDTIKEISQKICNKHDIYYLGRGLDNAVALEGALKLKEISYIHADAYPGGELKHGPIALIEDGTVVITVSTSKDLKGKMESNVKEVVTRGAFTVGIIPESFTDAASAFNYVIKIPDVCDMLSPVVSVVPLQLLAYYTSIAKGCDVDKPRNLAKSVTVE